jgi:ATP/maltotriose-dependent transcriptional regulator MalT
MLDTWQTDTTPYLLLAAPAGRGKSALLVRWLDSLKDREDLALAFVIGDRSEATCAC